MTATTVPSSVPVTSAAPRLSADARILGGLLGLAAGDALGATCEFESAARIARRGRHTEIIGGGAFGWRPGQGTDDTDLTVAIARAYVTGYSLDAVATNFAAWYAGRPRDIGTVTRTALAALAEGTSPRRSGEVALKRLGSNSAGNGSLMRTLPTGLVRFDERLRRTETTAISAITHSDGRCLTACCVYNDLVDALMAGHSGPEALDLVTRSFHTTPAMRTLLCDAADATLESLDTSGYVLSTLAVGVWALVQPRPLEDLLIDIVNRGGDADTTAAVAGGLLGVRDGADAVPARWRDALEYRSEMETLAAGLTALRAGFTPRAH